jgi:hypothetical protein
MSEAHVHGEYGSASASDVIISLLAAAVFGGIVWSVGVGVVAGLNYAGEYFKIGPPANTMIANAIQIAYTAVPILAGVVAAWRAYLFTIKLP